MRQQDKISAFFSPWDRKRSVREELRTVDLAENAIADLSARRARIPSAAVATSYGDGWRRLATPRRPWPNVGSGSRQCIETIHFGQLPRQRPGPRPNPTPAVRGVCGVDARFGMKACKCCGVQGLRRRGGGAWRSSYGGGGAGCRAAAFLPARAASTCGVGT